jgi:DNA-binding transcriptional ArsR family regulator
MPDLDHTLAALADPSRRAIVELLHQQALRPSDVADALAIARPAMSRHLRILRTAGLIEQETPEDDGRARTITLCREPFAQLRTWIEEVEAFWGDELAAFKAYAERKHRAGVAVAKKADPPRKGARKRKGGKP